LNTLSAQIAQIAQTSRAARKGAKMIDSITPVDPNSPRANNMFYVCSLIEYIARKTKNRRNAVVECLGTANLQHLLDLADVYHCDNIDAVADDFIARAGIPTGSFDNVAQAQYTVPSHWDMGKVYKRLALMVAQDEHITDARAIERVYANPICQLIDDYNGLYYCESADAIFVGYKYGEID
jgi:hypothetical protein